MQSSSSLYWIKTLYYLYWYFWKLYFTVPYLTWVDLPSNWWSSVFFTSFWLFCLRPSVIGYILAAGDNFLAYPMTIRWIWLLQQWKDNICLSISLQEFVHLIAVVGTFRNLVPSQHTLCSKIISMMRLYGVLKNYFAHFLVIMYKKSLNLQYLVRHYGDITSQTVTEWIQKFKNLQH